MREDAGCTELRALSVFWFEILVQTAFVERLFSSYGRVLTKFRGNMRELKMCQVVAIKSQLNRDLYMKQVSKSKKKEVNVLRVEFPYSIAYSLQKLTINEPEVDKESNGKDDDSTVLSIISLCKEKYDVVLP